MSLLSFRCRHQYPGGFGLDIAFELSHPVSSLFGPSGSGKTSVLSTIAGFLRPQTGKGVLPEIRLGWVEVQQANPGRDGFCHRQDALRARRKPLNCQRW